MSHRAKILSSIALMTLVSSSGWAATGASGVRDQQGFVQSDPARDSSEPVGTTPANPAVNAESRPILADSKFTDYTAGAVAVTFIIATLVAVLLIGGIMIVNLGMLSKREEDRMLSGKREPSDVAILKNSTWPIEPDERAVFPPEEPESGIEKSRRLRQEEVPVAKDPTQAA